MTYLLAAEANAVVLLGGKVEQYDPSLHCDYSCLRGGCSTGKCPTYRLVEWPSKPEGEYMPQPVSIWVNGVNHKVKPPTVSYAQIAQLAGEGNEAWIIYRGNTAQNELRKGRLAPGQTTLVFPGMTFNAVTCDGA